MFLDVFRDSAARFLAIVSLCGLLSFQNLFAQSNVNVRVMAANLNGNVQNYQPFSIRILQGTKADVVAIQEFNYISTNGLGTSTPAAMREMVDAAFGTNFFYYREPFSGSGDIPNGIISRYPILNSGSWADTVQTQPNRGYAWAQIDLPGTNDLYIVSVHLLTADAPTRSSEATNLKALIQANFPPNAWVVVAGDFNTGSRTESTTMTTFGSYVSDFPVPVDNVGNSDTSGGRNHPHDYVLPSFTLTNFETATVFPSHTFPSGLVFDAAVYTPLTDVPPVISTDSSTAQHMAVMKDFLIPVTGGAVTNAPNITTQPQSQMVSPGSNVTFSVTATGTAPLSYQWLFGGTNISGATTNPLALGSVQFTNAGNYSVIVTNIAGSVTSAVAVLTISNQVPTINQQPQSQTVYLGDSPTFSVSASGAGTLGYQWRFNGTNISGANTNTYTRASVQTSDSGNYTVVVTNLVGGVTSAPPAVLTVLVSNQVSVIAQWNFNSAIPDTNTATGTTLPSVGGGTAALVGGVSPAFFGGSADDPASAGTDNSGWSTSAYPAATVGNKTAGVQFNVSTAARQNIVITWSQRMSNTGSKYTRLQYTTNGTTFIDFPTAVTVLTPTAFEARTNSLAAIPGVNNNSNFAFRLVAEFENTAAGTLNTNYVGAGGSYGTPGTVRYDMVTISGAALVTNTPPISATLSAPAFGAGQFQFQVTGSAGVNYAVQISTNLNANNWISLITNSSPFTFTDTNAGTVAQKFYRAVTLP